MTLEEQWEVASSAAYELGNIWCTEEPNGVLAVFEEPMIGDELVSEMDCDDVLDESWESKITGYCIVMVTADGTTPFGVPNVVDGFNVVIRKIEEDEEY